MVDRQKPLWAAGTIATYRTGTTTSTTPGSRTVEHGPDIELVVNVYQLFVMTILVFFVQNIVARHEPPDA